MKTNVLKLECGDLGLGVAMLGIAIMLMVLCDHGTTAYWVHRTASEQHRDVWSGRTGCADIHKDADGEEVMKSNNTTIDELRADVAELQKESTELLADVVELQEQNAELRARVSTLETSGAAAEERILHALTDKMLSVLPAALRDAILEAGVPDPEAPP